jgi:AcrR family transcriptional regulator
MTQIPERSPERRKRGRPKGSTSAATKALVLEAAVDLIGEVGFTALTMTQVAERAGLSPSGVLHHFPSKEDLLTAVLAHRDQRDRTMFTAEDDLTAWDLYAGLVRLTSYNVAHPGIVRLFVSVTAEAVDPRHPAHDWMVERYANVHESFVRALIRGQADGSVRADAPVELLARQTAAVLDGLQLRWLLDPHGVDLVADVTAYAEGVKRSWGIERAVDPGLDRGRAGA